MKEKCYCYEYFKEKFGKDIRRGKCFKDKCARYRRESKKEKMNVGSKEILLEELRHSLPSRKILEVSNLLAIKIGKEYFVLKDRHKGKGGYVTKLLDESELLDYKNIIENPYHRYDEVLGKKVLVDKRILHRRGLDAIIEYLENKIWQSPIIMI